MSNPYRSSRSLPPRRGTFPAGRLRQVGATNDEIAYWRESLASLDADQRAQQLAAWDAMDNAELFRSVSTSLTGVPSGARESRSDFADVEPPDGNVETIRAWVMDVTGARRVDRAQAALDAEQSKPEGEQRVSLLRRLRELTRG